MILTSSPFSDFGDQFRGGQIADLAVVAGDDSKWTGILADLLAKFRLVQTAIHCQIAIFQTLKIK